MTAAASDAPRLDGEARAAVEYRGGHLQIIAPAGAASAAGYRFFTTAAGFKAYERRELLYEEEPEDEVVAA